MRGLGRVDTGISRFVLVEPALSANLFPSASRPPIFGVPDSAGSATNIAIGTRSRQAAYLLTALDSCRSGEPALLRVG